MKPHVNMCMKLKRPKDSKRNLKKHRDFKKHEKNKEIYFSFDGLGSIRTF